MAILHEVFDYINNHPMCTNNQIVNELRISGIDVLTAINELHRRGFLKSTIIPLDIDNDNTHYYSTIKKQFADNSEYCVCKNIRSVTSDTELSEFGYWDTCCICGKHLEDGFHYYNHYDGEDHDDITY